jgi:hypothetical protein
MTNIELQNFLKQYPDDAKIFMYYSISRVTFQMTGIGIADKITFDGDNIHIANDVAIT